MESCPPSPATAAGWHLYTTTVAGGTDALERLQRRGCLGATGANGEVLEYVKKSKYLSLPEEWLGVI